MDWAFKTSENVPSPFLLINLYSNNSEQTKNNNTTINAQISEEWTKKKLLSLFY